MVMADLAKSGCHSLCGDVSIPYPFGTGGDCNITEEFFITCSTSTIPNKAYLGTNSTIEVVNISLDGQMRILAYASYDCYNTSGKADHREYWLQIGSFLINNSRNKFTAIGCDTIAIFIDIEVGQSYAAGCLSICNNIGDVTNGSCSGIGCCQTTIPKGVRSYDITVASCENHTNVLLDNPCSYAFVAEESAYNFSNLDLRGFDLKNKKFPKILLVLDIYASVLTVLKETLTSQMDVKILTSVKLKILATGHVTIFRRAIIVHARRDLLVTVGKMERAALAFALLITDLFSIIVLGTGLGVGLLFLLVGVGVWWLYRKLERRKNIKLKEKFFERNGALLLQKKLSSDAGGVDKTKLFTSKELETVTDQYNENRILGCGGQGMVYKGMLQDGRIVAVKKSKIVNEGYLEQFINEIIILSQIDHRNVVKLLGCCLETEVPLLVYEFIPNGTLSQFIHDQNEEYPRSWDMRLRIAAEVASAISYLHSSASVPIYHRVIKSSNILLDEKFRAKVSDFGTSRSIDIDQTHLTTQVQWTFEYLDPEYFQSSQFTEKSDVYSFGVVLVELLTGQKPISTFGSQEKRGLVSYSIQSMDENHLLDTLDAQVVKDGQREELVAIAHLAKRCLNLGGRYRPTMKEVAMELERIRNLQGYIPTQQPKQAEIVVTKPTENWDFTSSSAGSYMNFSITSSSDVHPLMFDTL
ncbi:hypothetical protein REPUB_Repub19eG0110100 [Reevesia pubescens]